MIDEIYEMLTDVDELTLVGYGERDDTHMNLQQYASFAGADVTVAAKSIEGFIRLSTGDRSFDILVAEGTEVDGRGISLYVSSKKVDVADHRLKLPDGLSTSGRVDVVKFKKNAAIGFRDHGTNKMVMVVGTACNAHRSVPVFRADFGD